MKHSRNIALAALVLVAALALPLAAFAQTAPVPTTGIDQDVDSTVAALDTEAAGDQTALLTRLSTEFGVPVADLQALVTKGYKAGEIWLALEMSKVSGKALTDVIALTTGKEGHGWGLVAKTLGIKPGSKEFLAMKGKAVEDRGQSEARVAKAKGASSEKPAAAGKPAEAGKPAGSPKK